MAFLLTPEGQGALTSLLQYHVVSGVLPSSNLFADSTTTVPTVQGLDLTVTKSADGTVTVNEDATVVTPDVLASNGIIRTYHVYKDSYFPVCFLEFVWLQEFVSY